MGRSWADPRILGGAPCKRSRASGQPPFWRRQAAPDYRRGWWRYSACMWVVLLVLASCQDAAEGPGPTEAEPAQSDYPSLHTVPPRPQLSYPVEQRRAIVDGLIADRENARYSNQVVRYRTGLSGLPPPATPPVAAVPVTPAPDVAAAGAVSPAPDRVRDRPAAPPETRVRPLTTTISIPSWGRWSGATGWRPRARSPQDRSRMRRRSGLRSCAPARRGRWLRPPRTATGRHRRRCGRPRQRRAGFPTASSVPARVGTSLAARAPGVVWGMVDMSHRPVRPAAAAGVAQGAGASTARASSPAPMPAAAAVADLPEGGAGRPSAEVTLAGRAPGVVWGMVDMPDRPAEPAPAASAAPVADVSAASIRWIPRARAPAPAPPIEIGEESETTGGDEKRVEPIATAMADRPEPGRPSNRPRLLPASRSRTV